MLKQLLKELEYVILLMVNLCSFVWRWDQEGEPHWSIDCKKLHAFEMEYGYSKHQCSTALSSRESLSELNKQTLWEAWNSFACTVVKTEGRIDRLQIELM